MKGFVAPMVIAGLAAFFASCGFATKQKSPSSGPPAGQTTASPQNNDAQASDADASAAQNAASSTSQYAVSATVSSSGHGVGLALRASSSGTNLLDPVWDGTGNDVTLATLKSKNMIVTCATGLKNPTSPGSVTLALTDNSGAAVDSLQISPIYPACLLTFTGLTAGTYNLSVTGVNVTPAQFTVTIPAPDSASPFDVQCVSGCSVAGNTSIGVAGGGSTGGNGDGGGNHAPPPAGGGSASNTPGPDSHPNQPDTPTSPAPGGRSGDQGGGFHTSGDNASGSNSRPITGTIGSNNALCAACQAAPGSCSGLRAIDCGVNADPCASVVPLPQGPCNSPRYNGTPGCRAYYQCQAGHQ